MLGERIPLRRVKTMTKTLSGKNMLNSFLKEHAYSLFQISSRGSNLFTRWETSGMYFGRMVLHSAPWCSSLALGLIWRCHVGCWGWGSCRRQKPWAKDAQPRGEGTIILNSWSCWLGPEITKWQVNVHFCVKDVSLVWWSLFLLRRRQWRPTTVFLTGESQGWGSLVGYCLWGCTDSDTTEAT